MDRLAFMISLTWTVRVAFSQVYRHAESISTEKSTQFLFQAIRVQMPSR
jgi:hypothetical protein